jgi:carbamoyl-phosphate synthase large subunit
VDEIMENKGSIYRRFIKRPMDFTLSLFAIIILTIIPVLPIVALLVKTKLGSPVLFRQKRPGLNEKVFMMYKFRTMTDSRDERGELLPDSVRLTKFGRFLRSTSLDELPELFNILKGDMSIIGPRPLLVQYLPLYNEHQKRRHDVRPGLSGLAQVSGRNAISWEDKFNLDAKYVDGVSFISDWKIIFLTLKKVFVREGINSETAATMEFFEGNKVGDNKMSEINILILSAGRRVELVQCFQNAAKKLSVKSNIVAGDCSETAPALYFADRFYKLPRIIEPNYIDEIICACNKESISLIVPTIDTDLLLLAENKRFIEEKTKAKLLISDYSVVDICRDKIKTQKYLEENGFGIPKMYTEEEVRNGDFKFPLFIKPKSGSSSVNIFKVSNISELKIYRDIVNEPIIQDFMEGEEFTVDVFLDFDSNIISIVPRLRIATRSGEISKGKIIRDKDIINDVTKLIKIMRPIGHITVQLMKTKKGIEYIEINPRFGGGAPMSIMSGADSCENLFKLLMGEKLVYNENYKENVTFLRFDSSICLDENMELAKW